MNKNEFEAVIVANNDYEFRQQLNDQIQGFLEETLANQDDARIDSISVNRRETQYVVRIKWTGTTNPQ